MRTPPRVSHRRRLISHFVFSTVGNLSKPITTATTYTLKYLDLTGATKTATATILPTFQSNRSAWNSAGMLLREAPDLHA